MLCKIEISQQSWVAISNYVYCWINHTQYSCGSAESLQKWRDEGNLWLPLYYLIDNLRRVAHVSSFREDIKMLPIDDMSRMFSRCMVHQILSLEEPRHLSERLLFRADISQRGGRRGGTLHCPRVTKACGRKTVSYLAPKLYNDLSDSLKETLSVDSFKRRLRSINNYVFIKIKFVVFKFKLRNLT